MPDLDVRAALRDASWYRTPGRGRKYHVIAEHRGDRAIAACSPVRLDVDGEHVWPRMILVDVTARAAAGVPDYMRCQRPGCRQRWNEVATADA